MIKNILKYFFTVLFLAVAVAQAAGANEVRFLEEDWDPQLLAVIEWGAPILPSDMTLSIKPPPANESEETASELDYLRGLVAQRTPELKELIYKENSEGFYMPVEILARGGYEAKDYFQTKSLLTIVNNEATYFLMREKHKYQRARPSQLAPDLELVIDNPAHAAYPSGHAGQTWALALIMGRLDPAQAEHYKSWSREVAARRELAGVHYPSDSQAGRMLGTDIVEALLKSPRFMAFYEQAARELEGRAE